MVRRIKKEWSTTDEDGMETQTTEEFVLRGITTAEEMAMMKELQKAAGGNVTFDMLDDDPVLSTKFRNELLHRSVVSPQSYRSKNKLGTLPANVSRDLFEEALELYAPGKVKNEKSGEESDADQRETSE